MKYSVVYELESRPTDIIVEIVCKDLESAQRVYEERVSAMTLKNVRIKQQPNDLVVYKPSE